MKEMVTTAEAPPVAVRGHGDGWRMIARGVGELLITLGVIVFLFVAYELWFTGLYTHAQQHKLLSQITRQWNAPNGVEVSRADPHLAKVPIGSGIAVLRIPRFGKSYHMVIVEGTDPDELKKGPGHYPGTAFPGEAGNFAVAGHRTTYLHPFYKINELRRGDAIVIETKTMWFTYTVEDVPHETGYPHIPYREIVDPSDVKVAFPVPDQPNPDAKPVLKMLTLTSCNPRYSAAQRIVVHAVLTQALHKGPGVLPPALIS